MGGSISRGSVVWEGFVRIKNKDRLNNSGYAPESVEECRCCTLFLGGFEDVVGDVEGVVEVDGIDAKMKVR
jgi:hypothetical protein